METRKVYLELAVTVPDDVSNDFVASQVNVTLRERYWGSWQVSEAKVASIQQAVDDLKS